MVELKFFEPYAGNVWAEWVSEKSSNNLKTKRILKKVIEISAGFMALLPNNKHVAGVKRTWSEFEANKLLVVVY